MFFFESQFVVSSYILALVIRKKSYILAVSKKKNEKKLYSNNENCPTK